MSNEDYGNRPDGSKKGRGYFGEIKRPDGAVSTELSVSVEFDGKEQEIPVLVPTLSRSEIDRLIGGERPDDGMVRKAVQHARGRIAAGKNPFAEDGDAQIPLPDLNDQEQFSAAWKDLTW